MDDLLSEFLTETNEHLETVDRQLIEFERTPSNAAILRNIFRLVHTIKGTCGFLGLPRLEAVAHAAETLLGRLRDGAPVTPQIVTLILRAIDGIRMILRTLEGTGAEPDGNDAELIDALNLAAATADKPVAPPADEPAESVEGTLAYQVLTRALQPGEASLDELERAFRETPGPDLTPPTAPQPAAPGHPVSEPTAQASHAQPQETGDTRAANQTIRVHVGTLEHLMTMVSELVLTRNQLVEIARREHDQYFKLPLQRLSHITAELQDSVMKTRMQPIGNAWNKLPRLIRDLSAELGKKIELVMDGADTELDRQVLEQIKDPLMHMIRNSADHGIETPDERVSKGKPETGRIRLSASHESGSISIRISDDGKGLDYARIRKKALEAGIANAVELGRMTEAQVARFIFHPGFSTASRISHVSGRGVGMDVVRSNVEAMGGTIEITSEFGRGTTILVKIPLTLAIVSALVVSVKDQRYAIPQAAIRELVRVRPGTAHAVEMVNGAYVLRLRERLLPVVTLASLILAQGGAPDSGFVVVTQCGQQQFGIMVDAVLQTEEIVVKPMNSKLRSISLFSGSTIMGDGTVVLILDPNGLARSVGTTDSDSSMADDDATCVADDTDASQAILVFKGGGDTPMAVPLSLVTRLEEVDAATIEQASGRPIVQYRGKLLPIIRAHDALCLPDSGLQPLVIFSDGQRSMGMAVEAIVDIVNQPVNIDFSNHEPGVLGSAVISGRATDMIDLTHYLPQAYQDWLSAPKMVSPASPSHVLLLEQSDFLREMLSPVIRASGHVPLPCRDFDEAFAMLEARSSVGMIVADIENEASGGLRLAKALAEHPRYRAVPVLGLVSIPYREFADQARAAGITDLVAKFDRPALLSVLASIPVSLQVAA